MGVNDELALERTRLANWRTFLAYIRTGISFIALGAAVFHFLESAGWNILGAAAVALGGFFIITGIIAYKKSDKKISRIQKEKN